MKEREMYSGRKRDIEEEKKVEEEKKMVEKRKLDR